MDGDLPGFGTDAAPANGSEGLPAEGAPTASAGEGAAAPSTPQHVTREELAAILDANNRKWQSTLDKRTSAITRQLQAQTLNERTLEAAKLAGVEIPADKQAAFLKTLHDQGVLGVSGAPADAEGDGAEPEPDPVTQQGAAIAAMYGLTGADPEAKEIRVGDGVTSAQYLQSITLAGQKKLARLNQPNPAQMPGLTPAGGPPAKPDLSKKTRSQLLQAEVSQVMRKRG